MTNRGRPIISVAIATRNYGRYLPRALDSVFRCQNPTDAPLQVVVADDASTDNTRAVLADYHRRYPHSLCIVPLRAQSGVGAAKNAALARCEGRTVAILDADDEFRPDKLVHCHAVLERGEAEIVTNDFLHQTEEQDVLLMDRSRWPSPCWPPSTWVFRSGVVRFNPHSPGGEDWEWLERHGRRLRHRHLDLPLNVQHNHGRNSYPMLETRIPVQQVRGRWLGRPDPADALAPPVWTCRACGNQYLLPLCCCGHDAVPRPLLFYWTALSPHCSASAEFSLVMLTRNRLELTRRAVDSFLARIPPNRRPQIELIFVDGCSTDGTLDYFRELARTHPVKLLVTHPEEPFNYARACNRGARVAVGKYLLLLNNDIELRSDDPWEPLRAALDDPRVGVVGVATPCLEPRAPELTPHSLPYRLVDRALTGEVWGARRELYWDLGGQDEAFEGYGFDELDFMYRAQLAHYRLALAPVNIYHELHATYGDVEHSPAIKPRVEANYARFERKHGRAAHPVGPYMEPFASHQLPALSFVVVVTAPDEAPALRHTLEQAHREPACRDGSIQFVVVNNGASDDTTLVLEEYRLRLPHCLTVVTLAEPAPPARARQIGQARAVGRVIRLSRPGDSCGLEPLTPAIRAGR
jgi:glycosyltransferase involved in cell wall biosynthesis